MHNIYIIDDKKWDKTMEKQPVFSLKVLKKNVLIENVSYNPALNVTINDIQVGTIYKEKQNIKIVNFNKKKYDDNKLLLPQEIEIFYYDVLGNYMSQEFLLEEIDECEMYIRKDINMF